MTDTLPTGWKRVRLGDVCEIINTKILVSNLILDNYVSTDNMIVDFGGIKAATKMPFLDTVNGFKQGDILFSNIRTYFKKIWRATFDGGCSADVLVFRSKNEKIMSNDFLYRVLTNRNFIEHTITTSKGVKMPRGDKLSIMNYRFCISDKNEQQRIVDVLSSFDDKIENNLAMNKTLENIAKTLFKSWFVNFDPVHALARGENKDAICKRLYIDKDTLALFPDTFNAQGLPMGWEMKKLDEVFDYTMGQSPSGNSFNDKKKGTLFFQGRADFTWRYPTSRLYTTQPKRMANKGDILFSVRAPVGDINIVSENCCIGRGLCSIRHKENLQSYGLYVMLNISENIKCVYDTEGTVFGSINKIELGKWNLISPPTTICQEFNKIVSTMDNKIQTNEQENQTLTQMRDILLSELISGRVRVRVKEKEKA